MDSRHADDGAAVAAAMDAAMKVHLVSVARRPAWPAWAVVLVGAWLGVVALATWLSARSGQEVTLCLFKLATGKPCATCGATRGVLAALGGHAWQAWTYNPLMFTILAVAAGLLATRVIFARSLCLELTRWERRLAWALAIVLLAANWAYVIVYVG
jgi:hypothetical protein